MLLYNSAVKKITKLAVSMCSILKMLRCFEKIPILDPYERLLKILLMMNATAHSQIAAPTRFLEPN